MQIVNFLFLIGGFDPVPPCGLKTPFEGNKLLFIRSLCYSTVYRLYITMKGWSAHCTLQGIHFAIHYSERIISPLSRVFTLLYITVKGWSGHSPGCSLCYTLQWKDDQSTLQGIQFAIHYSARMISPLSWAFTLHTLQWKDDQPTLHGIHPAIHYSERMISPLFRAFTLHSLQWKDDQSTL